MKQGLTDQSQVSESVPVNVLLYGEYAVGTLLPIPIGMFSTDLIELIGVDEQVDQNDYGAHVSADFEGSGEILSACFMSTEDGTGDVWEPSGQLMIFNAAVTVAAGAGGGIDHAC